METTFKGFWMAVLSNLVAGIIAGLILDYLQRKNKPKTTV